MWREKWNGQSRGNWVLDAGTEGNFYEQVIEEEIAMSANWKG